MSTIKEISKKTGYSNATISYALKNDPKIPLETREKIQQVAKDLKYFPNASARALKTKKSYSIGIFVPGFRGTVHPIILSGIEYVIKHHPTKYKMLVTFMDEDLSLIYEKQIDIAVIFGLSISNEKIIDISELIPVILVDNDLEYPNVYSINIDNAYGIKQRVIDFYNKGSRKFMYMLGSGDSMHNIERYNGFEEGIKACGLNLEEQVVLDAAGFTILCGYECLKKYLDTNVLESDALICSNDALAIGSLEVFKERNIKVPQEIRVSGFDNIERCNYTTPPLSTIAVDWYNYGVLLGKKIISVLENKHFEISEKFAAHLFDRRSG